MKLKVDLLKDFETGKSHLKKFIMMHDYLFVLMQNDRAELRGL
jgi:hypothetical protein